MARNQIKGINIEIGGNTAPLSKALGEVNSKTGKLQSELREVEKLLKLDPTNVELVAQKQKLLAEAVEKTGDKLTTLKEAEKQAQQQFAEGKISEDQYRALQREIIKTEQDLNKLEKQAKDFGGTMTQQLKKAGEDMKAFGGKVEDAGKKLAPISAVAAGAVAGSVITFTSFDDAMKQVQATMGGTSDDYDKLSKAAQDMGANTRYSATEAADALNYLALAGYDTDKAIETLPKVLNLAQAGGMDLALASDMVTDSMAALGLESNQLDEFVDQLAATSQKSNTNVQQLGEGILTVGGTAKALAGGTTELNTVLGLLADNGIKGAEGGTKLRNMILSLTAPTDVARNAIREMGIDVFDASGEMRPLQDIMGDFDEALSHLSEGQKTETLSRIFNKADLAGVNALMSTNVNRWDELSGKISESDGVAQGMADTMESGLGGSFRSLKSALEGILIGLGQALAPTIQDLAGKIKGLADWFNGLSDGQKKVIATVLVLIAGLAPVLIIVGKLITAVGAITTALPVLGAAFTLLTGPVGLIIAGIAALIAIGVLLYKNFDEIKEFAGKAWDAISTKVKEALDLAMNKIKEWGTNVLNWITKDVPKFISNIVAFFAGLPDKLKEELRKAHNAIGTWITDGVTKAKTEVPKIIKAIKDAFINLPKDMLAVGGNIVKGIWDGITNMTGWLKDKVVGFAKGIMDNIKGTLKIKVDTGTSSGLKSYIDGTHANGLESVPFNGYLAELHKGEGVLTAEENRRYRSGGSSVNHTGTIRVEGVNNKGDLMAVSDIIMSQLRRELRTT